MSRVLCPLLLVLLVPVLGSCDGGTDSPLGDALSYLPADAALAIAVSTDLESEASSEFDAALQRFGVEGGIQLAIDELTPENTSFEADVRPLLGNDLVVGTPSATTVADEEVGRWVMAMRVSDAEQAEDLLNGLESWTFEEEVEGAALYAPLVTRFENHRTLQEEIDPEGERIALDGDAVVFADSRAGIEEALEQHDSGDGLSEDAFLERLEGLPDTGLIRVSGDAQSTLELLGVEQARQVPWIDALRLFGGVIDVSDRTLSVDAAVETDEVSEDDLPLAAGGGSPRVLGDRPAFANLDQAQTARFALSVLREVTPLAAYEEVTSRLDKRLDKDIGAVIGTIGEGVLTERDDGTSVSRTELSDPGPVADALDALHDDVAALAEVATNSEAEDAFELARLLIPALPVPDNFFFPGDAKVKRVSGEESLYRLVPTSTPGRRYVFPQPHSRNLRRNSRPGVSFPWQQFVFGLIGDVFVTAPNVPQARLIAETQPTKFDGPPGAYGVNFPIESEDVGLPGGGAPDVTVSTVKAGIEASTTGLRLRVEAGL